MKTGKVSLSFLNSPESPRRASKRSLSPQLPEDGNQANPAGDLGNRSKPLKKNNQEEDEGINRGAKKESLMGVYFSIFRKLSKGI